MVVVPRTRVGSKSTANVGVCVAEVFLVEVDFAVDLLLSDGVGVLAGLSGGVERGRFREPGIGGSYGGGGGAICASCPAATCAAPAATDTEKE